MIIVCWTAELTTNKTVTQFCNGRKWISNSEINDAKLTEKAIAFPNLERFQWITIKHYRINDQILIIGKSLPNSFINPVCVCTKIHFLDTRVYIQDDKLVNDLCVKETNRNYLLGYNSFHPKATSKSLFWNQLTRAKLIGTHPSGRTVRLQEMENTFSQEGYRYDTFGE